MKPGVSVHAHVVVEVVEMRGRRHVNGRRAQPLFVLTAEDAIIEPEFSAPRALVEVVAVAATGQRGTVDAELGVEARVWVHAVHFVRVRVEQHPAPPLLADEAVFGPDPAAP